MHIEAKCNRRKHETLVDNWCKSEGTHRDADGVFANVIHLKGEFLARHTCKGGPWLASVRIQQRGGAAVEPSVATTLRPCCCAVVADPTCASAGCRAAAIPFCRM
jgi:hypothetical protein